MKTKSSANQLSVSNIRYVYTSKHIVVLHLQTQGLGEGDEHPPTLS